MLKKIAGDYSDQYINPDHVVCVTKNATGDASFVYTTDGQNILVKMTQADLVKLLNTP